MIVVSLFGTKLVPSTDLESLNNPTHGFKLARTSDPYSFALITLWQVAGQIPNGPSQSTFIKFRDMACKRREDNNLVNSSKDPRA